MDETYRGQAPVRIDLDGTADYPLLVGRTPENALKEHRARHQRFRWAQAHLPAPNGWSGGGLIGAGVLYAFLAHPTAITGGAAQWFMTAAGVALLFPVAGVRYKGDPARHASARFLALYGLNSLMLMGLMLVGLVQSGHPEPPPHYYWFLAASATAYALLTGGQLASWDLRRRNDGYWDPRTFAETLPVQHLVAETLRELEPARQRLATLNRGWWERASATQTADTVATHPNCRAARDRLTALEALIGQVEETGSRVRHPATLERLPGSGDAEERLHADIVYAYRSLLQALDEADPSAPENGTNSARFPLGSKRTAGH